MGGYNIGDYFSGDSTKQTITDKHKQQVKQTCSGLAPRKNRR